MIHPTEKVSEGTNRNMPASMGGTSYGAGGRHLPNFDAMG